MATGIGKGPLPLNLQKRERLDPHTGCKDLVPALDPSWCKEVEFVSYVPPPPAESEESSLWLEALELIDSDLHWLLCQPHHRFWCQVIHDTSLHKLLDSYLRHGPRPHEATPPISLRGREVLTSVHRRVFMTFLRMSTHKESTDHFLLDDSFGDIIYNNFLFDITRLIDLCTLYHSCNHSLLSKMVGNVFARQPRYQDDLKSVLRSVGKELDRVKEECVGGSEGRGESAVKLNSAQRLPESVVSGVLSSVSDIAYSLRHFMDVYPPSVPLAVQAGLLERLVVFYGETIPPLQQQWLAIKDTLDPLREREERDQLRLAKRDLGWLVHTMIKTTISSYSSPPPSPGEGGAVGVARFLEVMSSIISEPMLLRELQRQFSLSDTVKEAQTLNPTFDQTQFDYILSALGTTSSDAAASLTTSVTTGAGPGDEERSVVRVQELLPHLNRPFILSCLKEYGYDAETVIHHVLEGSLPPNLQNLLSGDKSDGEGEVGEDVRGEGGLVDQRTSVYDGDEFDVFRRRKDIDLSQIHIGKRSVTTAGVLHDRSHLETTRERYQSYQYEISSSDDEEDREKGEYDFDQYQDEYDDTYDSHSVGAADSETAEDLFTVKRLNVKGLFKKQMDIQVEEEEEEEEGEGEGKTEGPLVPGHVTIMRRDHNQGRVSPHQRGRGGGGGRGRGRGEGKVTRERQLKEKHKGRVANHNRRAMADRKRGRGLGGPP